MSLGLLGVLIAAVSAIIALAALRSASKASTRANEIATEQRDLQTELTRIERERRHDEVRLRRAAAWGTATALLDDVDVDLLADVDRLEERTDLAQPWKRRWEVLNADLRTAALMEDDGVMTSEACDTVKSFIALFRNVDVLCSDSATPEDGKLVSQLRLEVGGNLNVLGALWLPRAEE